MKYTVVLNGCSRNIYSQAEETASFVAENLGSAPPGRCILFYSDAQNKEELIALSPAESLLLVKVKQRDPEYYLSLLTGLLQNDTSGLYLFPGDLCGSELAIRLAHRLGGSSLAAVEKIEEDGEELHCYKTVYSGYLRARLSLRQKPYCLSIARGRDTRRRRKAVKVLKFEELDATGFEKGSPLGEPEYEEEANGGLELEEAPFILVAGQGVNSREKITRLKEIAAEMGATFGVSRPVAMSAWAPLHSLIGVSGVITRPQLCIAVGISGAAAFFAGIEKSKYIVAVNIDELAPLVQSADVVVIDDYEAVLEELCRLIKEQPSLP